MEKVLATSGNRNRLMVDRINQLRPVYIYDFGCGERYILKLKFTYDEFRYFGYDLNPTHKDIEKLNVEKTIDLYRFQKKLFGSKTSRLAIASGILEYLPDPLGLIRFMMENFSTSLVSYCDRDVIKEKRDYHFINELMPIVELVSQIKEIGASRIYSLGGSQQKVFEIQSV